MSSPIVDELASGARVEGRTKGAAAPAMTLLDRPRVSVVIPARNESASIASVVEAVLAQRTESIELEVIVVDDGSTDGTANLARAAGAKVIEAAPPGARGNPAHARNLGAAEATGDPIVFLDADCTPSARWLSALLAGHAAGAEVVGGSLDVPAGLPALARCDHYCGSYHVHPRRRAGDVANHPPANLSVRREAFRRTSGFTEELPVADGHEELRWQAELRRSGSRLYFEPAAVAYHRNRVGFGNLLRRNYRWGYSALPAKAASPAVRLPWLYRHPRALLASGPLLVLAHTLHTLGSWVRAGAIEPLAMAPAILAARVAYGAGFVVGGMRWLARRGRDPEPLRPRWR